MFPVWEGVVLDTPSTHKRTRSDTGFLWSSKKVKLKLVWLWGQPPRLSVKGDLVKFRFKKPFSEQKSVHMCTKGRAHECQQQSGVKCIVA